MINAMFKHTNQNWQHDCQRDTVRFERVENISTTLSVGDKRPDC
jgi:hypothetical protein